MKTFTTLVSYCGNVYTWETRFARNRAIIVPRGGGEEICVPVKALRVLPSPGLQTTYEYAGSP